MLDSVFSKQLSLLAAKASRLACSEELSAIISDASHGPVFLHKVFPFTEPFTPLHQHAC